MGVSVQDNSRLRKIEELKAKIDYCNNLCATISELLKQRGIDISGLANIGLSSDEMSMIANYFICKNEQINLMCESTTLKTEEYSSQTKNQSFNHLEADKRIMEIKAQEETYRQNKHAEEKSQEEKSYFTNHQPDFEEER